MTVTTFYTPYNSNFVHVSNSNSPDLNPAYSSSPNSPRRDSRLPFSIPPSASLPSLLTYSQPIHPLDPNSGLAMCLKIGNLCSNAHMDSDGSALGQPTEVALLKVLSRFGLKDEREVMKSLHDMSLKKI